jgi:hypothetical protein
MTQAINASLLFYPQGDQARRLAALWMFTGLLSAWILLFGHAVLGFEQAWSYPLVGVGTAIVVQILLEWVEARARVEMAGVRLTITQRVHITSEMVDSLAPGHPKQAAEALGVHPTTIYRALKRSRLIR